MMRIEVFKPTSDDWYPSYQMRGWHKGKSDRMLVEVKFVKLGPQPFAGWRVCVWGGDDCGMEHDFADRHVALGCFMELIGLDEVNRADLVSRGFVSA